MSIHVPARATAMCFAALVGLLTVGLPAETLAQASGERVHSVRRLGGTSRFTPAVRNIKAMQTAFARPRTQTDLTTVLKIAGLSHIEAEVKKAIADGAVREVTMAPGTNLQWMALRRGGRRADILRLVRWDGPKPFPAFEFVVDDLKETYTFVIPQDCGNLSLVSREPSREQARRDAEAAAARAEEARKAEEARRAEEARKAEEARRAAEAAAAEAARKAAEAAAAEAARKAAEAAAAEAARQAAEAARLAEERELSLRPFVAGFFGKQRRQYDENDPAGLGTAFLPGFCDPLVGFKVGFEKKLGSSQWVIAPAVGVAVNTDQTDRTSLFVDGELNYKFGNGAYLGTGVGLWDFTHSDSLTPNGLVHFGIPLWKAADQKALFFVTEGRVFFDRASDIDSNYQFWGGLRFLFR
jgi:nucleoid-associated protein YgaU